jgi:hypothetical protein
VITHSFARFAKEGLGTPAPAAPPTELVVGGLYRHVRNPMYLALDCLIVGQAFLLGRAGPPRVRGRRSGGDGNIRQGLREADAREDLRRPVRAVPAERPGMVAAATPVERTVR